ncbi:MAG: hypothetical protein JW740_01830 [Candidatus Zambryskibacteria bacterium]|nr:hypothetical protein [Candidatus Zambryskibacteria bacterium]
MSKKLLTFGILILVISGILFPLGKVFAQGVAGQTPESCAAIGEVFYRTEKGLATCVTEEEFKRLTEETAKTHNLTVEVAEKMATEKGSENCGVFCIAVKSGIEAILKAVGNFLMFISSLVLYLCGLLFDAIIKFSIVDMAVTVGNPVGVGGAITAAWITLRDIANICFIFVLLYAAFKAMFDLNFGAAGTTIRNIIIIALLINFSLFFSKVVIDASNIVAVGFYHSITTPSFTLRQGDPPLEGISPGFMRMLGIQGFYGSKVLDSIKGWDSILVYGIMSSVFMLILAVTLLMASIMFIARYVILIFLMILSPLAFIAFIIPGLGGKFNEWKNALINQSFFAPIFFALIWVAFRLGNTLITSIEKSFPNGALNFSEMTSKPAGSVYLIINYVLIIGFTIAALIFSKKMAVAGATGSAFKAISGGIGAAAIGGAALAGRQTIGRGASRVAESERFQNWAARSRVGELTLQGTRGFANRSFDVRGIADTRLGRAIGAGKITEAAGHVGERARGGFNANLQRNIADRDRTAQGFRTDQQREAYAARISGGPLTRGGSSSSRNTIFGAMGRHNRVVASKVLNNQLTPLETQQQNLQNRENQLSQQLANITNEEANLQNLVTAGTATPQQQARLTLLNSGAGTRGSIANVTNELNTTQTHLTNVNNEVTRIRDLITNNGLTNTNPQGTIVNPVTGTTRQRRADEQNY